MDEMEDNEKAVEGALSTKDLQRPLPEKFGFVQSEVGILNLRQT